MGPTCTSPDEWPISRWKKKIIRTTKQCQRWTVSFIVIHAVNQVTIRVVWCKWSSEAKSSVLRGQTTLHDRITLTDGSRTNHTCTLRNTLTTKCHVIRCSTNSLEQPRFVIAAEMQRINCHYAFHKAPSHTTHEHRQNDWQTIRALTAAASDVTDNSSGSWTSTNHRRANERQQPLSLGGDRWCLRSLKPPSVPRRRFFSATTVATYGRKWSSGDGLPDWSCVVAWITGFVQNLPATRTSRLDAVTPTVVARRHSTCSTCRRCVVDWVFDSRAFGSDWVVRCRHSLVGPN